ncbi:DUF881 domain-containing protein [Clostridium formicaceticum]|uniref:Division initiation protein n=1 Tax=Clostridium formicaceticum TaxID=1497 RepID=A0AAC9RNH3_9CLOT|nr:DUF881 domain-containing protein [Clostridium formicaceticum]AOY74497.1 hypothetical protein BJL90_00125 [Clostridium formicaceticum]ARE88847.1 hypothetical protein CLFO_32530 [Clostridium formicaceticum]
MCLRGRVTIGVLCGILGLIISLQFNIVKKEIKGGHLSTQRLQQLTMELNNLKTEKEKLNEELVYLEERLKAYEMSEADKNLTIKNLKKDLERHQLLAGYKEGKGPGIVITVDDPPKDFSVAGEESTVMYYYDFLIALINQLNAAGAEGISINDQRYIATTEIHTASNTMLINAVPTRPPITIKAIGNPEGLEAAMNMKFGIIWTMKEENLQVNVKKEDAIVLPRYNKVIQYQYAKPVEYDDTE